MARPAKLSFLRNRLSQRHNSCDAIHAVLPNLGRRQFDLPEKGRGFPALFGMLEPVGVADASLCVGELPSGWHRDASLLSDRLLDSTKLRFRQVIH